MFTLFVAVASIAVAQSAPEWAGTLPEDYLPGLKAILQTAVRQAPDTLLAELEIERYEAKVYYESRQRWPDIGSDFHYDASQTAVSGNSNTRSRNTGLFYVFRGSQALYYWGEIKNRTEAAKIEVAIRGKQYAEAFRSLAVQLRQTYLELVARNAELRALKYDLQLGEAALAAAKADLSLGTLSAGEVAGRELQIAERQVMIERKQAEFDALRRRIGRLSGSGEISADSVPVGIPLPRFDARVSSEILAGMLRGAGSNAFQTQVAELQIKHAELNYRIARVRLLPKFDASVEHSRESSTTAATNYLSQTAITRESVGIKGSWKIFDGFATKGAKLEAQIEKREAQNRLRVASESAMMEAQSLERFASIDARSVQLSEQRRAAAEAGVAKAEEERAAGRASKEAVEAATSGLRRAESEASYARMSFLSNWGAFVSLAADDPALNNLPPRYARFSH